MGSHVKAVETVLNGGVKWEVGGVQLNAEYFIQQYEELKKVYKVNHLLNEHKKYIFILESPHIDELLNLAPVAGLSGKAMSKVLFGEGEKVPLGIKIKSDSFSEIGIMNICPIPMQAAAYSNDKVTQKYGEFKGDPYKSFFNVFEKLRTNTKASYKNLIKNELQAHILDDFKKELEKMSESRLVLIPCGKTAGVFLDVLDIQNPKWQILLDVPHPSYGNWHKEKYSAKIAEMMKMVMG